VGARGAHGNVHERSQLSDIGNGRGAQGEHAVSWWLGIMRRDPCEWQPTRSNEVRQP
jgi:hypothetical protein